MPKTSELQALLQFPAEKATIEYKSWLDLSENRGRATLAKAAIALANEGGGIIVLGMREDNAHGRSLCSCPLPAALRRYSQDAVNAAINRYADPQLHCELAFATHPGTDIEHAFVCVPGGLLAPVMSKRDCEAIIAAQRCYVRKPGPRTEEPFTAEEWRGVLERCVAARRESMLNAIRIIVQGHGSAPQIPESGHVLSEFSQAALDRWADLIRDLPSDDTARMPLGHYEISFQIRGVPSAGTARELRRRMETASSVKYTGWSPFVQLTRSEFEPRFVQGYVEAWIGRPVDNRFARDSAHCDYWRAHSSGLFFLLRGYDEDAVNSTAPGTIIDLTLPVWRTGEALLYASRLGRTYGDASDILVKLRYTGLRNRRLSSVDRFRFMPNGGLCYDDEVDLGTRMNSAEIEDNLVELLHPLLAPLYERFDFFELTLDFVREEVTRMRSHRF
jgi:hypothetical protein